MDARRGWIASMVVVAVAFGVVLVSEDAIVRPLAGGVMLAAMVAQGAFGTIAWRRTGPHDWRDFLTYRWLLRDPRARGSNRIE